MVPRLARLCAVAGLLLPASLIAQNAPAPSDEGAGLDPASPLAPLPHIGVDWPDLATGETVAGTTATAETIAETRYTWDIEGIDAAATPLLRQRFDQLSALSANDGDAANAAQLERRGREDAELLVTLLRGEGYYDARVSARSLPPGPGLGWCWRPRRGRCTALRG